MATPLSFEQIDAAMADDNAAQQDAALFTAVKAADDVSADQYAQAKAVAEPLGVSPDLAMRNPDLKKKLSEDDIQAIFNESPEAKPWIEKNAKLLDGDFSTIGRVKSALNTVGQKAENVGRSAYIGLGPQFARGFYGTLEGITAAAEKTGVDHLVPYYNPVESTRKMFATARNMATQDLKYQQSKIKGDGYVEQGIYSGISSLTGQLPATLLSVATGNPMPSLATAGLTSGGNSVADAREAGKGPGESLLYGASDAAIEIATEKLPIAKLIGDTKVGSSFFKTLVHQVATEVPGELTATTLQNLNQWAVMNPDKPFSTYLKQLPSDLGQTVIATLTGVGANTGIVHGVGRAARWGMSPEDAQAHVDGLTQLGRTEPLAQRSPEDFHSLMQTLNPDEHLYIDGQTALDAIGSMTPEQQSQLFNAVPTLRDELDNAVATGADVKLSKADYAAYIAPHPQADSLRDFIKLDPEDQSVGERAAMQKFLQENPETAKMIEQQVGELPLNASAEEMMPAIERIVRKSLIDSGRGSVEARAVAPLFARTMARFSAPFGQNAVESLNSRLLQFQSVDEAGNAIAKGSNIKVILNDLQQIQSGKRVPGMDDIGRAAVEAFGQRLKNAGITPEEAQTLDPKQLIDTLYPQKPQATVRVGDTDISLPQVEVGMDENGGLNIGIRQAEDTSGQDAERAHVEAMMQAPDDTIVERPELDEDGNPIDGTVLEQDQRGNITFRGYDAGSKLNNVIVSFTQQANFSTAAHEFSHFAVATHRHFAELAREQIAMGETNPEIQRIADDWEALREEVGATSDNFTVEQEEMIADKFEAYLRTGTAPSEKLHRIFTRFRDWLTKIYKDIRTLGGEPSKKVTEIFDRWIASEDEIAKVREKNNSIAEIAKHLGLPDNIIQRVADYVASATSNAEASLYRKLNAEERKRQTQGYKDEFARVRKDVVDELNEKKEYQIVKFLKENRHKLYVGPEQNGELGQPPAGEFATDEGTPATLEEINALHDESYSSEAERELLISELLKPAPKKPQSLIEFLRSKRGQKKTPGLRAPKFGLKDEGGELSARGLDNLINNKSGMSLDHAREVAVEAGYLHEEGDHTGGVAQTDINTLLDAIDSELDGNPVYRSEDADLVSAMHVRQQVEEYADRYGITQADLEQARADKKKYGAYSNLFTTKSETENAIHPDNYADLFGFDNGLDLVRALRDTPDLDRVADRETRERLMDKYPDMIKSGRIVNEAVDAIYNDRTLLALDLMIKEMGGRQGMKQFARAVAQQQVAKMNLGESNYGFRFELAREKSLREALQASRAGKPQDALLHLQRAMVNQIMYKQLQEFRDLRDKAEALFKKIDEKDRDLAPTKDIDFLGAARGILHKYGLGGQNFDFEGWLSDVEQRTPDVINDILGLTMMVSAPQKNAKELTIAEFKDIYNAVENIYDTARKMKEFEKNGKKYRIDAIVEDLLDKLGEAKADLHEGTSITGMGKIRNGLSSVKAAMRRVELWAKAVDGGSDGPFSKFIYDTVKQGEVAYQAARDEWLGGYLDILKEYKADLNQTGKIPTNLVKQDNQNRRARLVFKNRMEMIGFLLHTGNESNLDKLLGGYGIPAETLQPELERLTANGTITARDWQLVQKLWNYVESLKPIAQQAHKKLYGFRFDEIESKPFMVGDISMRGGYWPAIADGEQSSNNKTVEQLLQETRQYMLATVGKGFTKNRVSGYRQPLKTDLRLGSQHIDKVLRFAHIEPAVRDVARIINRQEFKDRLKAVDYDAFDGMLQPWLSRVATQTTEPPANAGDRSARMGRSILAFAKSAAIAQIMYYNIVVPIQNFANMSVALRLTSTGSMARAFAQTTMNPLGNIREMKKASPYMAGRLTTNAVRISNQLNEIAEKSGSYVRGRNFLNRNGYIFAQAVDSYLGTITWQAAYNDQFEKTSDDKDAIRHADSVVRQVMGSGASSDVSKIEASHPLMKAIMPFYGYFNSQINLISTEFGNIMREHGWAGSPKMFMAYVSLVAAPAIIGDIIAKALRGGLPGEDEDDEDDGSLADWMAYATESQVRYLAAGVPLLSPAANSLLTLLKISEPTQVTREISPILSGFSTVKRTTEKLGKLAEGEGDDMNDARLLRDVMTSMGLVTGLPLGQAAKPLSYAVDVEQGETTPQDAVDVMRGVLTGPPRK